MMTIQNYVRAQSLEEAYQLNQKRSNRIIGGMLWMKMKNIRVNTAIDLCDLKLDYIEESPEEFSIGAMTSLRQLEVHEGLNRYTQNAVRTSVENIVGVQFRNMATLGGSLWGRFGFSDILTVFLTMDSYVELYKGGIMPLAAFAGSRKDNDILVRLIIKKHPGSFTYRTVRNQATDLPVLTCGISRMTLEEGQPPVYRAAIGARPGRALVVTDDNKLLADGITEENADAFAAYAGQMIPTGSNLRGSQAYRSHLIQVLVKRNLMAMEGKES